MRIGTKSLLFGVHQFLLHPWVVAWGWWRLWGFRTVTDAYVTTSLLDWRLWLCFWVHDWGYWGCPEMDGAVGEAHPFPGARLVTAIADPDNVRFYRCDYRSKEIVSLGVRHEGLLPSNTIRGMNGDLFTYAHTDSAFLGPWGLFSVTHSRFLAKHLKRPVSALCAADKYAISVLPAWIYLPLAWLSGELDEYVQGKGGRTQVEHGSARRWYRECRDYCRRIAEEMKAEVTYRTYPEGKRL